MNAEQAPTCSGRWVADYQRVARSLRLALERHADKHGLTGPARAVFLARGGHAPGEGCPLDPPPPEHEYWCPAWEGRDCYCGGPET